ncbi:hypothetical protein B566_EDAN002319 [Ephemera danica]|nr:hypothetical protein B566_EDAN002319 [Ephemera danica]
MDTDWIRRFHGWWLAPSFLLPGPLEQGSLTSGATEYESHLSGNLEQIGKLVVVDGETSSCKREELYARCNILIETLLTEETYPACIESLQQLQYSLVVQGYLWKEIHKKSPSNVTSSCSSFCSDSPTFECMDSASAASGITPRHHQNQNTRSEYEARCVAIAKTKRTPSCKGLDQVAGLEEAKQLLQEALVLPTKYPQLFQGVRQPWTSVLLYGPPGTGKTRLAHAVAAEISADFYCLSAADLLSSWVGESEKLIKELFSVNNKNDKNQKPIIFIDEIDSLCRKRSSSEAEHARRLKTELLIQMEEASKGGIFLLCATNCPWDVDAAFLRRFQRRIYIPTPNRQARLEILQFHSGLDKQSQEAAATADVSQISDLDWAPLLDSTEGYSGSDLATLAQYALLQPVRELQHAAFWAYRDDGMIVGARDLDVNDFMIALSCTPSTVSQSDLELYENFTTQYGQFS